jgi:hypothetical protein
MRGQPFYDQRVGDGGKMNSKASCSLYTASCRGRSLVAIGPDRCETPARYRRSANQRP